MRITTLLGIMSTVITLTLGGLAFAAAPQGNPALGAELYNKCTPCHGLDGKGMAGKPAENLLMKMQAYQNGTFNAPKIENMQKVLKTMNQQNLIDLAAYISQM